jgi:phytoene desaturase
MEGAHPKMTATPLNPARNAFTRPPIAIIGAGIGGLSAAIRLAGAGHRVQIFEQNAQVGGKMNQIHTAGYRWDTGPSVITMRHVFEDLFHSVGLTLSDYLTLNPVDPLTRYFYPNQKILDVTSDLSHMSQRLAAFDERDVAGYLAYLAYAARLHRLTGPVFIYNQPPTWRSFLRVPPWEAIHVDAWRTMHQAIGGFVRSPELRQLLGRFATYVGASPYQAPATLNVIAHVELTGGVWYPQGGIYQIAHVLAKVARSLGVKIHLNQPVRQILLHDDQACGLQLASGERVAAAAVIANVDVANVYQHLLPPHIATPQRKKQLTRLEPSCSGFVLLLGVAQEHPQLAHHNIFFSDNYRREFHDIFKKGRPPSQPTIYLAITSKATPSDAPPHSENWFVLVNAPPLSTDFNWAEQKQTYRNLILNRLAEFGLDVRPKIAVEHHLTPQDLATMTGAWRGALYGASSNNPLAAFMRPHNRAADVRGLYFAGGTTHPGGGVPMVTLSGKVAANLLQQDWLSLSN